MKKLVIIKIGGSVITKKDSNVADFNKRVAKRLFNEIKTAKQKKDFDLILVHGAGSFGHPLAKKYRLNEGFLGPESAKGAALTKVSVLKLNTLIIDQMINSGLNAITVATSAVATTKKGKINSFNLTLIKALLTQNMIPVLYGDVVVDNKRGISILSGDQTVVYLAKKLNTSRIIFVSDVDGVYDKNPKKFKDAKLIPEINKSNYKNILEQMESHNKNDVTGEMKGKILEVQKNLLNVKTIIISGLKKDNLKKVLSGDRLGSLINF